MFLLDRSFLLEWKKDMRKSSTYFIRGSYQISTFCSLRIRQTAKTRNVSSLVYDGPFWTILRFETKERRF